MYRETFSCLNSPKQDKKQTNKKHIPAPAYPIISSHPIPSHPHRLGT